jgi:hypothetical protein
MLSWIKPQDQSSAVSIAVLCAGKSSAGTWENKIEKQSDLLLNALLITG